MWLYIFCAAILLTFCILPRIIVFFINIHLKKKYRIQLYISHVGFFSGKEIVLTLSNGARLLIDRIGLTSHLFNSHAKSFLTLWIGDVRLETLMPDLMALLSKKSLSKTSNKASIPSQSGGRNWIAMLVQFTGLHVQVSEITVVLADIPLVQTMVHFTVQQLDFFATFNPYQISFNLEIVKFWTRVYSSNADFVGLPLANVCCECLLECKWQRSHNWALHSIQMKLRKPVIYLTEDLLLEVSRLNKIKQSTSNLMSASPTVVSSESSNKLAVSDASIKWPKSIILDVDQLRCDIEHKEISKSIRVAWKSLAATFSHADSDFAPIPNFYFSLRDFNTSNSEDTNFAAVDKIDFWCHAYTYHVLCKMNLRRPFYAYQHDEALFWTKIFNSTRQYFSQSSSSISSSARSEDKEEVNATSEKSTSPWPLLANFFFSKRLEVCLEVNSEETDSPTIDVTDEDLYVSSTVSSFMEHLTVRRQTSSVPPPEPDTLRCVVMLAGGGRSCAGLELCARSLHAELHMSPRFDKRGYVPREFELCIEPLLVRLLPNNCDSTAPPGANEEKQAPLAAVFALSTPIPHHQHTWGHVLYCSKLQVSTPRGGGSAASQSIAGNQVPVGLLGLLQLNVVITDLQVEFSGALVRLLEVLGHLRAVAIRRRRLHQTAPKLPPAAPSAQAPPSRRPLLRRTGSSFGGTPQQWLHTQVALTANNVNLIARSAQTSAFVLLRSNRLYVDSTCTVESAPMPAPAPPMLVRRNQLDLNNCKMAYLSGLASQHGCCLLSDFLPDQEVLAMKELRAEFCHEERSLMMFASGSPLRARWTSAAHLCALDVLRLAMRCRKALATNHEPSSPTTHKESGVHLTTCNLTLRGPLCAEASLEDGHCMALHTGQQVRMRRILNGDKSTSLSVDTERLTIRCDGHDLVVCSGVSVASQPAADEVLQLRTKDGLSAHNPVWLVKMEQIFITFPYNYNFYSCFDSLVTTRKFLRNLSKSSAQTQFSAASGENAFVAHDKVDRVAPDYVLKVAHIKIQLVDDPFEVQLEESYLLWQDEEVNEMPHRRALLLRRLRQTTGPAAAPLSAELLAAAVEDVQRLRSDIFVRRMRELQKQRPATTPLFTFEVRQLELYSLADATMTGRTAVMQHIRSMDPHSPLREDHKFSQMWCRQLHISASKWKCSLRSYPQPMWRVTALSLHGRLGAAESAARHPSAERQAWVRPGEPWLPQSVIRCMLPLKYYHDWSVSSDSITLCHGPCFEPTLAWFNICMDKVNRPSRDPSPPMGWWDKARLKYHGSLRFEANNSLTLRFPTSLNPYNRTEFMDWIWTCSADTGQPVRLTWTNMLWLIEGDFSVMFRTASKYDDCRLLYLPALKTAIELQWFCEAGADPNDHHSVQPVNPECVPPNSAHDSYRLFRSHAMSWHITWQCAKIEDADGFGAIPQLLFYTNLLKLIDRLTMCFKRVARPIRRGALFHLIKPKKPQFFRIFRRLSFDVSVFFLNTDYWVSFKKRLGVRFHAENISCAMALDLRLVPFEDQLVRRPRTDWIISHCLVSLRNLQAWLSTSPDKGELLSLNELSYKRNTQNEKDSGDERTSASANLARHYIQVTGLKIRWTVDSRNQIFCLMDTYKDATLLRKVLSAQATKTILIDKDVDGIRARNRTISLSAVSLLPSGTTTTGSSLASVAALKTEPSLAEGGLFVGDDDLPLEEELVGRNMLEKLIQEAGSGKFFVNCEQTKKERDIREQLHGLKLCEKDDVIESHFQVELVNSQIMLTAPSLSGYIIVCAARTKLRQANNQPVWAKGNADQLLAKSSMVGQVRGMQYYATVQRFEEGSTGSACAGESALWLSEEQVLVKYGAEDALSGRPEVVGSGMGVGGVVSSHVGPQSGMKATAENNCFTPQHEIELQRVIPRCDCELFYISYEDADPAEIPAAIIPPRPSAAEQETIFSHEGVNTFTLFHHTLEGCTNSLQYDMVQDIMTNLLFHVDLRREQTDRLDSLRMQLVLESLERQKEAISREQAALRSISERQRELEREVYQCQQLLATQQLQQQQLTSFGGSQHFCASAAGVVVPTHMSSELHAKVVAQSAELEKEVAQLKQSALDCTYQLQLRINTYQARQLEEQRQQASRRDKGRRIGGGVAGGHARTRGSGHAVDDQHASSFSSSNGKRDPSSASEGRIRRINQVCFEHLKWRLNEADGQCCFAEVTLKNFVYTRVYRDDDSGAHQLEIGHLEVLNRLEQEAATRRTVLRVESQDSNEASPCLQFNLLDRPPVGGMSIKGLLELSVGRIHINITKLFYRRMFSFFFLEQSDALVPVAGDDAAPLPNNVPATASTPLNRRRQRLQNSTTDSQNAPSLPTQLRNLESQTAKMRERAAQNVVFHHVKIPELQLILSYKGEKERNFIDLTNCLITTPVIELQNRTMRWQDLAKLIKDTLRRHILKQSVTHKLKLRRAWRDESQQQPTNGVAATASPPLTADVACSSNCVTTPNDSAVPPGTNYTAENEQEKLRLILGAKILRQSTGQKKKKQKGFFS